MLRICICDDVIKDLETAENLVNDFGKDHPEFHFTLRKFQSPYDLLDCVEEIGCFDLFISAIVMQNIDGIELGKKIRARREPCEIIYLSVSREYGVAAFSVEALDYLVKPVKKAAFDNALLHAMQKLTTSKKPVLIIKIKNGIRKIFINDIVLIESLNHHRQIRLVSGEMITTEITITSIAKMLSMYENFQFSHRAYLVNLDYAKGLDNMSILMYGGVSVPISRNRFKSVKRAFMDYML